MNDRELLELAAKAAGIEEGIGGAFWTEFGVFDPLTDDGDALRLAVKLDIDYYHYMKLNSDILDSYENDPYTATRRAIVRAAAEIGKEMK